jgi:hypothetical protein
MKKKTDDVAYIWVENGKIYKVYIMWNRKQVFVYEEDIIILKLSQLPIHKLRKIDEHLKDAMEEKLEFSPLQFLDGD